MANIIFNAMGKSKFHNELLQEDLKIEKLLMEYNYLNQESTRDSFIEKSKILKAYLKNGSAKNVANWLLS